MCNTKIVSEDQLIQQLGGLEVETGGVLLVHAAFSRIAPVEGGPHGLIDALLALLGEHGTLVMPSMADDDDTPFDRRYRQPKHATVMEAGRPKRYEYGETDHCCENFRLLDHWLEAEGRQRRGLVGNAPARLACSRDIVSAALERLRRNETVFLHASGSCGECDAARAGAVPFDASEDRC